MNKIIEEIRNRYKHGKNWKKEVHDHFDQSVERIVASEKDLCKNKRSDCPICEIAFVGNQLHTLMEKYCDLLRTDRGEMDSFNSLHLEIGSVGSQEEAMRLLDRHIKHRICLGAIINLVESFRDSWEMDDEFREKSLDLYDQYVQTHDKH